MKNIFAIAVSTLLVIFMQVNTSCDKIDNPIEPVYGDLDTSLYPGPGFYVFPEFDATFPSNVRNILIEDYTGHTCGNCPSAAVLAHDIKEANPGRVFVSSVHAAPNSEFQDVSEPGDDDYPKYSHDFRTEEGNNYVNDISGFFANPSGMINRKTGSAGSIWLFAAQWLAAVDEILLEGNILPMNLQVKTNYYTETNGLFVHVQTKTLESFSGKYSIVVCLIDDEFISWQKDYSANPQDIEFYHHKDVFLGTINGTYGSELFDGSSSADEVFENHYSYAIPSDIEMDSSNPGEETGLSIIAYLMNRDTYEIIQVSEIPLLVTY